MRIVSGTARGKKLVTFSGSKIRPTSDRVREAVFSSLFSRRGSLHGRMVLDLFAGTGALGIEALSRGAAATVFVDNNTQAIRVIRQNLENCGFSEKGRIIQKDVLGCWPIVEEVGPFDIIFLDPPYGKGLVTKTLRAIREKALLTPEGIVCAETSTEEKIQEDLYPLVPEKTYRYGLTLMHFFQISDEGKKSE